MPAFPDPNGNPQEYGLPQGILIDGRLDAAVPRKSGAYDTEGIDNGAAVPEELLFFVDSRNFGQPNLALQKTYGRDTNITSKDGGMAKGEKLYAYGLTAKIDPYNVTLNSAANAVSFDEWRRFWGISAFKWLLGGDEFMTFQARDVPLWVPAPTALIQNQAIAADSFVLLDSICREGMLDITIQGQPYLFDQQEDFRIVLQTRPQTLQFTLETYITLRIEGIRIKAVRQ